MINSDIIPIVFSLLLDCWGYVANISIMNTHSHLLLDVLMALILIHEQNQDQAEPLHKEGNTSAGSRATS